MRSNRPIEAILRLSPVIPTVTIEDPALGPEVARALVRGGICVLEVSLRTYDALGAIEAITRAEPDICVGAGTVLSLSDLHEAVSAGAAFATSPGSNAALLSAGTLATIPYLPGVATASELMNGLAAGFSCFNFFPAASAGGLAMLRTFGETFPDVRFMASGGILPDMLRSYLDLPNVVCASGEWLATREAVAGRDWVRIEALASRAAAARPAIRAA